MAAKLRSAASKRYIEMAEPAPLEGFTDIHPMNNNTNPTNSNNSSGSSSVININNSNSNNSGKGVLPNEDFISSSVISGRDKNTHNSNIISNNSNNLISDHVNSNTILTQAKKYDSKNYETDRSSFSTILQSKEKDTDHLFTIVMKWSLSICIGFTMGVLAFVVDSLIGNEYKLLMMNKRTKEDKNANDNYHIDSPFK